MLVVKAIFSLIVSFFIPPAGALGGLFLIVYFTTLVKEPMTAWDYIGFWLVVSFLFFVWLVCFALCLGNISEDHEWEWFWRKVKNMKRYKIIEVSHLDGTNHYEVKTYLWGWIPTGYVQEWVHEFHGEPHRVGRARWKTKEEAMKWVKDKLGSEVIQRTEVADMSNG